MAEIQSEPSTRQMSPHGNLFETYEEFINAPPLNWVIEGLAQEQETNMIAGLSGHGKTWIAMCIAKALLEGGKLFGTFPIHKPATRVIYLVPEVGRRPFFKRLKLFRLDRFVEEGRLLVRTLSKGPAPSLVDAELLLAAEGADVFLDTAVRFMQGEEDSSSDNRSLAGAFFRLLQSGARSVWAIHHSAKSFEKETSMTLENTLRGSGDIGAMLSNAYGVKQLVPEKNLIHVECLKGRDLDELVRPFQIEGRPWIDQEGSFHMVRPPGECESLAEEISRLSRRGEDKRDFAKTLWDQGISRNKIVLQVREKFGTCSDHTVSNWIKQWSRAKQ
jgi:hypothetical protein